MTAPKTPQPPKLTAPRARVLQAIADDQVWFCGHHWALYKAFNRGANYRDRENVTAQAKWLTDQGYARVTSDQGRAAHCTVDRSYKITDQGQAVLDALYGGTR